MISHSSFGTCWQSLLISWPVILISTPKLFEIPVQSVIVSLLIVDGRVGDRLSSTKTDDSDMCIETILGLLMASNNSSNCCEGTLKSP